MRTRWLVLLPILVLAITITIGMTIGLRESTRNMSTTAPASQP